MKNNSSKIIKENLANEISDFEEKLKEKNVKKDIFLKACSHIWRTENLKEKGWPDFKNFISIMNIERKKLKKKKEEAQEVYEIIDKEKQMKLTGEALARVGQERKELNRLGRTEY